MAIIKLNESYYESIDSESPTNYNFGDNGSTAVMTFVVAGDEIIQFINDVLGYANLFANSYITRPSVPASHPLFPFMYASKIQSIKGYVPNGKVLNSTLKEQTTFKDIQIKTPPYVGVYDWYKIVVLFETREYMILTNEDVWKHNDRGKKLFMPKFVKDKWEVITYEFTKRCEWLRFFNISQKPQVQLLTFGNGNYFCKGGLDEFFDDKPMTQNNTGSNNITYPTYEVVMNWFMVPYQFIFNNWYINHAYSTINHYDWVYGVNPYSTKPFAGYPRGSLLFKKMEVTKYEPSYPFNPLAINPNSGIPDYYRSYNDNQYCDIKYIFEYKDYLFNNIYTPDPGTYVQLACKNVTASHNMIPHPVFMKNYYVESSNAQLLGKPIFWDYAHECLFIYSETEPPLA